jgi:inosine-uridine nucleoside N-ribohydrolase
MGAGSIRPQLTMKKVIMDCDPGIDDSVALMFAHLSNRLKLIAITTVSGNLTADRCATNASKICELIGIEQIPIAQGMCKPLIRPYPRDPFSHGDDGLGNLGLAAPKNKIDPRFAPDLILELVNAHPGEITILATGPLTNIALALMKDRDLPKKTAELILIGGSFGFHSVGATRATGDNPVSEWNIYVDPEAAKIVFEAGFNLLAIGLDVATRNELALSTAQRDLLRNSTNKAAWFVEGVTRFVEERGFRPYCALIDSLAVAAAIDPEILTIETIRVAVETESKLSLGQTVVDRREKFAWNSLPTIKAVSDVDWTRFLEILVSAVA